MSSNEDNEDQALEFHKVLELDDCRKGASPPLTWATAHTQ